MRFGIADSIASRCLAHPDGEAIQVVGSDLRISYHDLWRRISALAEALSSCGPGRYGKMVGLLLPNCPDAALAVAACQRAGVVAVPINGRLTRTEMQFILSDADCRLLLSGGEYIDIASEAASGLAIRVMAMEDVETTDEDFRPVLGERDLGCEPCVVGYTSGTTGSPKGAIYTHDYYTMNNYRWGWQFGLTSDHVVLIAGPMFHLSYAGFALAALMVGARVRIMPEFSAAIALDELRKRSSFCFLVPSMLSMMVAEWEKCGRPKARCARHIITAGAPARLSLLRSAMEMFPAAKVSEMYGWTEGAFVAYEVKDPDTLVETCVGWPALGADVVLFDDAGRICSAGEAGEVAVRSGVGFAGYLGNEAVTAESQRDGYLLSGDIGRWLPDGRLCIIDRKKDVVISGGENVYTVEVERALLAHDAVEEAAVVGVPDAKWGERVAAMVVTKGRGQLDAKELIAFCRSRLAGYKIPRIIEFADELPRNSMGKVQKFRIVEKMTGKRAQQP